MFQLTFLGLGIGVLKPNSMILTDLPEIVPLLEANIALNKVLLNSKTGYDNYCAVAHTWGEPLVDCLLRCDTIIASDVVYDPIGYEPLIKTLCDMLKVSVRNSINELHDDQASIEYPVCVLAHRHRNPENHR